MAPITLALFALARRGLPLPASIAPAAPLIEGSARSAVP
jgi:hypothetical protein